MAPRSTTTRNQYKSLENTPNTDFSFLRCSFCNTEHIIRDSEYHVLACYNLCKVKLEKIVESNLTKTIFATLAVSAVVGTLLVFPSFGYIVKFFMKDENSKRVRRVFHSLEKQNLISISEKPNGEVTITLTEAGKQKALTYQIEKMKLKKPKVWDKIWRVIIFDIPEGQKKARDVFRGHLKSLDLYSLQKSVFVTPYPCKDEIDFLKHNFEIAQHITYLEAHFIDNQNKLRNYFQV